jgi:hypothetical protein
MFRLKDEVWRPGYEHATACRVKRRGLILLIHLPMTDPRIDKPAANKYPDGNFFSIRAGMQKNYRPVGQSSRGKAGQAGK